MFGSDYMNGNANAGLVFEFLYVHRTCNTKVFNTFYYPGQFMFIVGQPQKSWFSYPSNDMIYGRVVTLYLLPWYAWLIGDHVDHTDIWISQASSLRISSVRHCDWRLFEAQWCHKVSWVLLTHWLLGHVANFQRNFSDWYLRNILWKLSPMNVTGLHWW